MRILQGSCYELFKDPPKIFVRILKDPQGSDEDLTMIFKGSYQGSLKDLCQDPKNLRRFDEDLTKILRGSCISKISLSLGQDP